MGMGTGGMTLLIGIVVWYTMPRWLRQRLFARARNPELVYEPNSPVELLPSSTVVVGSFPHPETPQNSFAQPNFRRPTLTNA